MFLQLCGWLGTEALWSGGISDSLYQMKTNIFKKQNEFSKNDLVNGEKIPFTNIFDKGYRLTLLACQEGKQLTQQPVFARSDEKFTGKETLRSGSLASDRSGNERAVKVSKRAGYIQRGIESQECPIRMDNVWKAWSFQTNFMYKSIV